MRFLDRVGEPIHLVGIEEQHLRLGLARGAHWFDGIGGKVAGVHGEGEHAVEDLASLTDPGGPESRCLEVRNPFLDGHTVDVAQLIAAEGGQDVGVEVRPVPGKRLRLEMCLRPKPPLSPLLHRDLRKSWVGPVTADQVGLDGGHESIGVDLVEEAPRRFPT